MANLSKDAPLRIRRPGMLLTENYLMDSSAANTIYKGQPVILDKSADTTKVRGWVAATTLVTATDVFIGIAAEGKAVASGDLEIVEIEVITDGEVGFKTSSFTDADIGKTVTFSDSGTLAVAAEAADACTCGTITRVADGYVYVELSGRHIITF